nr:MAG: hypothetical protein [Microvirus sp.]
MREERTKIQVVLNMVQRLITSSVATNSLKPKAPQSEEEG